MAIDELQRRIAACRVRRREADRIQNRLDESGEDLELLKREYEELADRYRSEAKDVEQLEGNSFKALYLWVTSQKREVLARERDEMAEAKLRLDAARAAIAEVEDEMSALRAGLEALENPSEELSTLEDELEQLLLAGDDDVSRALRELGAREVAVSELQAELDEAARAGIRVLTKLKQVDSTLATAGKWGVWDMFGGGLIATHMKHANMTSAQHRMVSARSAMRAFDRELRDVQLKLPIELDLGGLGAKTADYLFDGLLIDWFMQSKINKGRDSVRKAHEDVEAILKSLQARRDESGVELERLAARRSELLGSS